MEVTMLRDKFNTGMRYRLDNLTIDELVKIQMLLEHDLKESQEFIKGLDPDEESLFKNTKERVETYKNMLSAIENKKTIQLTCYYREVEKESFEKMIKKYKLFK